MSPLTQGRELKLLPSCPIPLQLPSPLTQGRELKQRIFVLPFYVA